MGWALSNYLQAGAGADVLNAGAGSDSLLGGAGADTLIGGLGDDWLKGGKGGDIFSFDGIFGNDVIVDYEIGVDTVKFIGLAASAATLSAIDGDTIVDFGAAGSVTLIGVLVESVDEFTFA